MHSHINYFYTPISGYAYLGEPRLMALASEFGLPVRFFPVDIGQVFRAAKVTPPAAQSPAQVAYRRLDLARTATRHSLPINPAPAHWPVDPSLACRVIYAAGTNNMDQHKVSMVLLGGIYAQERNIADQGQVHELLHASGLNANLLLRDAALPEASAALAAATETAVSLGVIGSPTYFLDGEPFFGQDRLADLQWRLEQAA